MTNEELLQGLSNCKSIADVYRLVGLNLSENGSSLKKKLNLILSPLGMSADMFSKSNICRTRYEANPSHCLYCGKKIEFERRGGKFCNSSCAASYNNLKRGSMNEETKKKISDTIKRGIEEHRYVLKNQYGVYEYGHGDDKRESRKIQRVCPVCGKEFIGYTKTCSPECLHQSRINAGKNGIEISKNRGTWKPWQSRNITSYAEKFWKEVLDNNLIPYTREFFFDKKYFLDFMIVKNGKIIDLEIDGHQHNYKDRKEHDQERDEYLKEHNVQVYRISWNCLNTDIGKENMKHKIDSFLEFYNNL